MAYRLDKHAKKSAYIQLYEQLRRDITAGVYPYGKKMPSKRLLSEEAGVSVVTAEHAYALLSEEGYIEARERSGYFVIYRADDFLPMRAVTPFAAVTPTVHKTTAFPFSVLARTMRRVLAERGEDILVKSPNHGCAELRAAVAEYLQRRHGMAVTPRQIIIGSGAEYLYSLLCQMFRGCTFALEDPSYDKIRRVYEASGIPCDLLRMEADGIASVALAETAAGVLHVTPFNSYPSGVTASASKRAEYLRWAERRDGYIVEDNYDSELTVSTKNEDPLFSLCTTDRVIYLNTFSRTVAPAMRVGYMVLPSSLLSRFEEAVGFYSCTVPVFEQYVLAQLINSGDFERHIHRVRRARRRELVI
ncbi:MAG: PLP-dependent aminotransferase family protein [Ruminococcaceae bacterium]|nr:PLP-dependent aminotransferase family protein [Oscillospiraceae bacterium]